MVWGYTISCMLLNLALKIILGVLAAAAVGAGGYYAVKTYSTHMLSQTLSARLDSGDYLAALAAAGNLKEEGKVAPELNERIAKAARLLVAEDALKKAKAALDEKRYTDASALLRGSDAVTDSSFKYYEEAKKLYEEAEALSAGVAHRTNIAISALEKKAKTEQTKRQELEQNKRALESTLSQKEQSLSTSRAETAAAKREAEASQKEVETRQTALAAEQARARQLMEQVEKEVRQKFFTELRAYRDMAQKGKEQLENAVTELNAKRDVTALIYVSQGKILFEEAKSKTADLRNSRTPSAYQSRVDDLIKALGEFLEASKQLRNAVVYIDEQGSAEFTGSVSKGKATLANAVSLLSGVSDLVVANP